MNQYQRELQNAEDNGTVEEFKKEWFKRACAAYRNTENVNDFRSGKIHID